LFENRRRRKIEKRRGQALETIRTERTTFDAMVQRAQMAGSAPDEIFLSDVRSRLDAFRQRATEASDIGELDDLIDDAEEQGELRAYVCPPSDIADEGKLVLDLMAEWNVPKSVISALRATFGDKLSSSQPGIARSALRAVLAEQNSWWSYTKEYEEEMRLYTSWLVGATIVLLIGAIIFFRHVSLASLGGLLCAGGAGSCVSVMSKMPTLEVGFSGELDAYLRRIVSRIGTGTIASFVGCGLLGWGLLSIGTRDQTFVDLVGACVVSPGRAVHEFEGADHSEYRHIVRLQ
jgi:hypothetical protein